MMTRKQRLIIILSGIFLVVLLGVGGYLYWRSTRPIQQVQTIVPEENTQKQTQEVKRPDGEYVDSGQQGGLNRSPAEVGNVAVKAMASSFVERIGSYSNQSDYANIIELEPFMTASMRSWADGFIRKQRIGALTQTDYYGVNTKVLSVEELSTGDDRVTVSVKTQKVEYRGAQRASTVSYVNADVVLVKNGSAWLIDSLNWR